MQQFANGKVNGDLQVVLYQLYLPATAICSRLYLKTELTVFNILGGCALAIFVTFLSRFPPLWRVFGSHEPLDLGKFSVSSGCVLVLFSVGVMAGCALVAVPGIGPSQSLLWPFVYGCSAVPLGMACVLQVRPDQV
jgi:hypothetical protein